jgi:hypothetical protein
MSRKNDTSARVWKKHGRSWARSLLFSCAFALNPVFLHAQTVEEISRSNAAGQVKRITPLTYDEEYSDELHP